MTTAVTISPSPILSFLDNNGRPCVGGTVLTQVGGLNATTYQDSAGTIPLPNPIILNNRGEIANSSGVSCQLFLANGVTYTFTLLDAQGNQLNQANYVATNSLIVSLAVPAGAGLVGFSQSSSYPIGSVGAKLQYDGISVRDAPYGAYGDAGVHDDTAAINAAIAAAIANGQSYVSLPPGNYRISSPLTVSGAIAIIGAGRTNTQISWTSTTMVALNIATSSQVIVRGITFAAPTLCTAGGCIALNGAGGVANAFSQITDCVFSNGFAQLTTATAYAVKIRDNYFSGAVNSAITIQNTVNVDAGDSSIVDNEITNLGAAAIGIVQASSGGLKIHGNKIIGGTQGMALSLSAAAATSILLVSSNSIELSTAAAITLVFGAGSSFSIVDINDNDLSQVPIGVNIPGSGAAIVLSNVNVSDNIISLTVAGTFGIIINNVSNFTTEGNTIVGNGGTPTGINIGGFSSQGRIGLNNFPGCTTKVANASGTTYIAPAWVQTGAQAVTCSTARGSLFYGTAAVTFGVAFDAAPTVTCDPGTLAGGLSAWATAITKTGFTLNATTVTSGGTGNCAYSATGLI